MIEENTLFHFKEYNEQIFKVYDDIGLKNLSQVDFDGKNSGTYISDVLRRKHNIKPLPFSDFKIHDELDFITKDLKHIVGTLFFLKPYIVDTQISDGKYFQNLEDRRYLMSASFGVQCVYNFWDRIGDLLYLYFDTNNLKERSVFVHTVLEKMDGSIKESPEFINFKSFYEENIKPFFKLRNEVVHYFQLECTHYWGAMEYSDNQEKREELNKEKFELADTLKLMLEHSFTGFDLALKLINTLPDKWFFTVKVSDNKIVSINEVRNFIDLNSDLAGSEYLSEGKLKDDIINITSKESELVHIQVLD